jgi:hypothetical protein
VASLDGNEQYADAEGVAELLARMHGRTGWRACCDRSSSSNSPSRASRAGRGRAPPGRRPAGDRRRIRRRARRLRARARLRLHGISSKTCKGFYKSLLNAARCAAWNAEAGGRYFMSAEDLTTQAGLSVQQDLALVNLLGITHVERNGHHYVNGMAALPRQRAAGLPGAHPDLYEDSHGAVRLRIRDGRIALASLDGPGFASAAMPDWATCRRWPSRHRRRPDERRRTCARPVAPGHLPHRPQLRLELRTRADLGRADARSARHHRPSTSSAWKWPHASASLPACCSTHAGSASMRAAATTS